MDCKQDLEKPTMLADEDTDSNVFQVENPETPEDLEHVDNVTSQTPGMPYEPQPCTSQNAMMTSPTSNNGLIRTISSITRVSTNIPVTPPPDGGAYAYFQIFAVFLTMCSTWGVINTWGVCQTYYTSTLLPTYPQSTISWVGSLQVTLVFFVGIVSGRLADGGYYYPLVYSGMLLQVWGMFMTSLSTEFYQVLLAQGLCYGIGNGLIFTPMTALLSTYFEKKRSLAIALGANGAAVGGMVYPAVLRELIPRVGFPWAIRTVAFLVLLCNGIAACITKWRLPPRKSGPLMDIAALRERAFVLAIIGMFFVFWALYFAFFYIGVFARAQIGVSYIGSIDLLLVMNGIGIPSRIIPGFLADRYTGPMTMLIPFIFLSGTMLFVWIAVSDLVSLYVFALLYGIGGAAIQSLFPATLASLAPDIRLRGSRIGMGFFVASFAVLSGPPIAGALVGAHNGGFLYAQIWGGGSMIIGVACIVCARVSKTGLVLNART